ncbi:hypothetical protein JQX13_37270 [Archangium violaceum]|uniref:hypothetical protein n=1 Tax=Archangium violaceum TaxID=83451 RepID=UPI00193B1E86|nr:hypothetical protein [Archangium violaceum]QRK05756.1 hypothetical protein JQX13_37270 [Archangium violaceum]
MSAARFFIFDDSLWPLLTVRMVGEATSRHFDEFLDISLSYLHRREPHVVVTDMLRGGMMSPRLRHRLHEWMKCHEQLFRETLIGEAFVLDSPFLRLGLSILFHLRQPPCPYFIDARVEPAFAWAADQLENVGQRDAAERVRQHFGLLPSRHRLS